MSQLFRRLAQQLGNKNVTVMIISQVRDKIGVAFGRKYSRSGGRALDFYASQVIYLAQMSMLKRTIKGVERPIGVEIKAQCTKNKVSLPFRNCQFPIIFGYGVDDIVAGIDWLVEVDHLKTVDLKDKAEAQKYKRNLGKLNDDEFRQEWENVSSAVKETWKEIETEFLPKRRKY